jgi:AraC-like DNA-binding protein
MPAIRLSAPRRSACPHAGDPAVGTAPICVSARRRSACPHAGDLAVRIRARSAQIVLTRMADVIFVQVLRAYIESLPEGSGGLLGALRDKQMAAALGVMHQRREEQWTVGLLADEVGISRSAFAARFTKLVGEPPLGYLTRLRMQRASLFLREGATLAAAAQMTGYASEASFSYAFRQWSGIAPGAYRRQLRSELAK